MWIHFKARRAMDVPGECDVCFHSSQAQSISCIEFGGYYKMIIQFTHQTSQGYIISDWNIYADIINMLRAEKIKGK